MEPSDRVAGLYTDMYAQGVGRAWREAGAVDKANNIVRIWTEAGLPPDHVSLNWVAVRAL